MFISLWVWNIWTPSNIAKCSRHDCRKAGKTTLPAIVMQVENGYTLGFVEPLILGEVKARPKDIISFSLDYISKSKVQTSNPSSSPISLDTPARPADLGSYSPLFHPRRRVANPSTWKVHSGKLTWLAGKWTRIESMYSLLNMGIFPASHVTLLEGRDPFFFPKNPNTSLE